MILTGKAKEAFLKHSIGKEIALFEAMLPIYQHALIIEWLDSVGIITEVIATYYDGWTFLPVVYDNFANKHDIDFDYDSRQQATEKAIERAVEIYLKSYEK